MDNYEDNYEEIDEQKKNNPFITKIVLSLIEYITRPKLHPDSQFETPS